MESGFSHFSDNCVSFFGGRTVIVFFKILITYCFVKISDDRKLELASADCELGDRLARLDQKANTRQNKKGQESDVVRKRNVERDIVI